LKGEIIFGATKAKGLIWTESANVTNVWREP